MSTSVQRCYIARDGQPAGPFDLDDLQRQVAEGVLDDQTLCWHPGMLAWQPLNSVLTHPIASPASAPVVTAPPTAASLPPLFLHVPVSRLVTMSFLTLSLYEAYWMYRNWCFVRDRDGADIWPFSRAVFSVFFCHSLLGRMHEDRESLEVEPPRFDPWWLASGWVALTIISSLVDRVPSVEASVVAALIPSFLCLVPVQRHVNLVTARRSPGQPPYGWTWGQVVLLFAGIIIWLLLLVGLVTEWYTEATATP